MLVTTGIDSALAAKNASSTIPVVFAVGRDSVELGLAAIKALSLTVPPSILARTTEVIE